MSWAKLLADNRVTVLSPSKAELDNLRSIVARSLKDVTATGLSADARFVMAYDAARTLSLLVVRAAGCRRRAAGGHYNTFLALEAADSAFAKLSAYFDGCRMKPGIKDDHTQSSKGAEEDENVCGPDQQPDAQNVDSGAW
jgi:hypothetical protein